MARSSSRSGAVRLLLLLIALTALGAIPAGYGLAADPTGAALWLDPGMLHRGPFSDYRIPGLFLLVVLGLGALPVIAALWTRRWWGVPAALAYGVVLLLWITIQALIIGILSPLQPLYGTIGLVIVVAALAAGDRRSARDPG